MVVHAEGFVKKNGLDLKLFKQLYWLVWHYDLPDLVFRLAWLVFVTIALTPSPITPIIKGGFPQNTYRGQVCLLQEKIEGNQENFKKGFLERFPQIVEIIYTLRFVRKMNKFVDGQCPGGENELNWKIPEKYFGTEVDFLGGSLWRRFSDA